jgi:hypothetical protein
VSSNRVRMLDLKSYPLSGKSFSCGDQRGHPSERISVLFHHVGRPGKDDEIAGLGSNVVSAEAALHHRRYLRLVPSNTPAVGRSAVVASRRLGTVRSGARASKRHAATSTVRASRKRRRSSRPSDQEHSRYRMEGTGQPVTTL